MIPAPDSRRDTSSVRIAGATCAFTGLLLLSAVWMGVVPLTMIGRLISADADISTEKQTQFAVGQQVFGVALLGLGLLSSAAPGGFDRLRRAIFNAPRAAYVAGLLTLGAASAIVSYRVVFDGIPHVTDAISHLFQARIFIEGRWYAEAPECPLAFFQHHIMMTTDGKWFTKYPPGHPMLLALGLWLGTPFALPLAAHLLLLITVYGLARLFFEESESRSIALLLAVSPLNILLGGSMMSHTTFLAAFLGGAWALATAARGASHPALAVAAGFAFGWSLLIRPHEFLISAAAVGCGLLVSKPCQTVQLLRRLPLVALGALPCVALQAIWNHELYGRVLALGYGYTADRVLFPMYQSTLGLRDGFGVAEAARLTLHRLVRFEQSMLGWPVTLPLLIFALPIARDPRVRFLATASAVHIAVYFFYDYLGHEYEARYYFNILPPVLALLVNGIARWASGRPAPRAAVLIVAAAGLVHAAGAYVPLGLRPTYGPDYEQTNRCLHERALRELPEQSLVLISCDTPETRFRYSSGFLFNDPALTGRVVYARAGDEDWESCVARAFPHRKVFRYIAPVNDWCNGRFEPLSGVQSDSR